MTPLDRVQIDRLVRELEDSGFQSALAATPDRASAESLLLASFTAAAPFFPRSGTSEELGRRIEATTRRRSGGRDAASSPASGAVSVPNTLHVRLVDAVEEHQSDEPIGRKKAFVASIAGVVLVGALATFGVVHWRALADAQPIIADTNPAVNGKEVPVQGDFWVRFTRSPSAKPSISVQPADLSLDAALWDGNTVLVSYRGLHLASTYVLTIEADYQSPYGDRGHFVQHWRFTTEGYPVLAKLSPGDGSTGVFRYGQLAIDFNHRPPVTPVVTLTPADGNLQAGQWIGSTWLVRYGGLTPLTSYRTTLEVNYGVPKANIKTMWSFTTEPGAPPAGVPVIWYSTTDPNAPTDPGAVLRMVAIDWTGRQVGTMYPGTGVQQSADGSVLQRQDGALLDRSGAVIDRSTPAYASVLADDNRTVCQIVDRSNGALPANFWLYAGPLAGPLHPVAAFGPVSAPSTLAIIACSALNNRAVLAESGPAGNDAVAVLQLTTGRALFRRSYPVPSLVGVSSSHDGRYLAEESQTLDSQGQPVGFSSLIRRVSDSAIVARLDNQRVVQFSWDGTRVLVAPPYGASENYAALIEWQTGKALWRLDGPIGAAKQPILGLPRPNGGDLVVATPSQAQPPDFDHLWLIHADGTAALILDGVFYPAFVGY